MGSTDAKALSAVTMTLDTGLMECATRMDVTLALIGWVTIHSMDLVTASRSTQRNP